MKPQLCRNRETRGSTLLMVLIISMAAILVLVSTLEWTNTNTTLAFRNNEYYRTVAIAEAATEKVIARIESDYQLYGDATVKANVDTYKGLLPTSSEDGIFANYKFTAPDPSGTVQDSTYVQYLPPTAFRVLTSQYAGLYGYASAFRIISNARETTSRFNIVGAVAQDVEVATIPLFQFAIFYNLDLEINPGQNMTVTGPVHSNQEMYLNPGTGITLTFMNDVTTAGTINNSNKLGDTLTRNGTLVFAPGVHHEGGKNTLNLPIGTNNSPEAVRQVVEVPPGTESATSDLGKERFYNKAELVITITDTATNVTSGRVDSFATPVPKSQWTNFLDPYEPFYNKREGKTIQAVQIDVGALRAWSSRSYGTNSNQNALKTATILTNNEVQIVYVVDQRSSSTNSSLREPGVRLVNGSILPAKGLTVASPDPMYILGDYNTGTNGSTANFARGTTNTAYTLPAAVIGDAITILSGNWHDVDSTNVLSARDPVDTTVNAAFLAGVVQTIVSDGYSGGAENFPRFLEDWGGTFWYNGSMVVMYESRFATEPWQGTGAGIGIYNAPTRKWAFDLNFRDPAKLPPGTPMVRTLVRGAYAMIAPNSTNMVPLNN